MENLSSVVDVGKTVRILHPVGRAAGLVIDLGTAGYEIYLNNLHKGAASLIEPATEALFKATTRGAVIAGETYSRAAAAFGELNSRAFGAGLQDKMPN